MPFRPRHSFLRVESSNLSGAIQTDSVEDLFGMWSMFSKTSHSLDNGRRLENLSWRLWNRETFCCRKAQEDTSNTRLSESPLEDSVPRLSSSCDSAYSSDEVGPPKSPPELKCANPCQRRHEKHITSNEMQKIIQTIEETRDLEPIHLPMPSPALTTSNSTVTSTATARQPSLPPQASADDEKTTSPPQPPSSSTSYATRLESSQSTVDTANDDQMSQTVGSDSSSNTEMSTHSMKSSHSIIRGFVPGGAPSSYRSQTNLAAQPTPILKNSPHYQQSRPKKKTAMFTIGTSSGEDESSLDSHMLRSSLSESFKRAASTLNSSLSSKKQTSFKDEVMTARAAEHSPVFEESDEEEEEVSESAIEDDDDSSDWEDSDDHSRASSLHEGPLFQRVDSRPNLTSQRSLLTTLMHEPDRAKALLQNAASRSTPAMRRSGRSTPNGPSVATSPEPGAQWPAPGQEVSRARPIMTSTNIHQPLSLSPRTTRRNMLSTELTESLRKNLLWERQHRSTGNLAALKRRQQSEPKLLRQLAEPAPVLSHPEPKRFNNDYFDAGLQEYHAKGW